MPQFEVVVHIQIHAEDKEHAESLIQTYMEDPYVYLYETTDIYEVESVS